MLNEVVIQPGESTGPGQVVTADYTSATLWDITATKKRRKVLYFLKNKSICGCLEMGAGIKWKQWYLALKLQKLVIISYFFSIWLDLHTGS